MTESYSRNRQNVNDNDIVNKALRAMQGGSDGFVREELACTICYQCRTPLLAYKTFWTHPNKALLQERGPVSHCNDCLGIVGHVGRFRHE